MPPGMNNGLAHQACAHVEQHSLLPLYIHICQVLKSETGPFPLKALVLCGTLLSSLHALSFQ
jgi:hypothetical protein